MKEHEKVALLFCLMWVATLLYGEMFAFWVPSLFSCSWPHLSPPPSNSLMDGQGNVSDYWKVAILADPQLMDKTSLHLHPKSLALELAQFYTDLYMRRAFFASILPFKPDVIMFLGDYFDGGPYLSDNEWQESLNRYKHIFGLNTERGYANIQVYNLTGNHDIGYAALHSRKPEVIRRYEKEFGSRNYKFMIGNVEFIAIDAQSLDVPKKDLASVPWDFINTISEGAQLHPRVLLTHIPLYRPDWTDCGPYRSSRIINQRMYHSAHDQEITYQNYISEESSNQLLNLIKPVLVLSGHDHDQCKVQHQSGNSQVTEQTLGTISWQQGNLYPSFMLLSARNMSMSKDAVLTHLCFLPMQTHIYIWYLSLFVVTIIALFLWPASGISCVHCFNDLVECGRKLMSFNILQHGTKEKIDDDNCEFEMIWSADGAMHLVKKTVPNPVAHPTDKDTPESLGSAVMRPAARKSNNQGTDLCLNMDVNVDKSDSMKLPPRASKSRTMIIIPRLVRTLRMIILIAAVNIPLYMMLLFKDWIDK